MIFTSFVKMLSYILLVNGACRRRPSELIPWMVIDIVGIFIAAFILVTVLVIGIIHESIIIIGITLFGFILTGEYKFHLNCILNFGWYITSFD